MRSLFSLLVLWLINMQMLHAQVNSIQLSTSSVQLCRGTDFTFYFTPVGTFEPGITYQLQLALGDYGTFQDIPGSFTSSPATIRLPDNLVIGPTYRLRLISSKPIVYSNIVGPLRVQAVPTARLLGSSADSSVVTLGESVALRLALTGGEPYSVWVNDTLRFYQTLPADAYNSFRVVPEKTSTYRLTRVLNGCGAGQASGATTLSVSSVGFRLTKYPSISFCPGDTLYPGFSTTSPLPASTQFTIDWLRPDGSFSHSTTAMIRNQSLVVPTSSLLSGVYTKLSPVSYTLVIRQTELNIRTVLPGVSLRPVPSVALTESVATPFGQPAVLLAKTANTAGLVSVIIQDSSIVGLSETTSQGIYRLSVQPLKTTDYSIKQIYTGGCDALAQLSGKATVTVTPGIRLDSVSRPRACSGDDIAVFYTTNFTLTDSANDFVVEAGDASDDGKLTVRTTFPIIRMEPGQLIVKIPSNTVPALYAIRVRRQRDGLVSSLQRGIYVNTIPAASLPTVTQELAKPSLYNISVMANGGTDGLEIILSDGTRLAYATPSWSAVYNDTYSAQVSKTATYTIQTVRNQCGTGQATGRISLSVIPPTRPTIQVTTIGSRFERPSQVVLCEGQQTTVQFAVTGPQASNTLYKVEMNEYRGDWVGLFVGSGTASPISITLPSYAGRFKLRIVSSDGTISNEVMIDAAAAAVSGTLSLLYPGPLGLSQRASSVAIPDYPKSTVYLNSSVYDALIKASSGPLNGKWIAYPYSLGEPDSPLLNTTYTIQAISKACVRQVFPNVAEVQLVPFLLYQKPVNQYTCPGDQILTIPYTTIGNVPANTRFVVDISGENGLVRTLPAPGGLDYVRIPIADLQPSKSYRLQLKAILPNQQVISARTGSSNTTLTIRAPFSISLSAEQKQTVVDLPTDQYATLYLNGNDNFSAVLSNGTTFTNQNGVGFTVQPLRTTQYRIRSAWAECGFAVSSSSVTVRVPPGLRTSALSSGSICRGQKVTVSFQAVGDFEPGHRFGIFIQRSGDNNWQLIAETMDVDFVGDIQLASSLRTGRYQVKVESRSASAVYLSKEIGIISVVGTSNLVLGGSATAYAGDLVRFVVPGSGGDFATLTLLGGSKPVTAQLANDQLVFTALESATYQLSGVSNGCGVGTVTGSITVQVLPSSSQSLRLTAAPSVLCAGQTADVRFTQTGSFGSTNRFTIQLSDSTGRNFRSLLTSGTSSPLTVTIPSDVISGGGYRLRVVSSEPALEGSSGQQPVLLSAAVSGTLTGSKSVLKGDSATLTMTFSGLANWEYTIQTGGRNLTGIATTSPYRTRLRVDTTTTYKLVRVSSAACGLGQSYGEAVLTVSPLTATEPLLVNRVHVFPNPTAQFLTIAAEAGQARPLSLYLRDVNGHLQTEQHYTIGNAASLTTLSMAGQPAGIYFLELVSGSAHSTVRIVKN